uniref:RanBP2-type domain-containing protein n=1 Tax=Fagus sylvatica TaxID=28930 RepID=A0A2N9GQU0_FAGSY
MTQTPFSLLLLRRLSLSSQNPKPPLPLSLLKPFSSSSSSSSSSDPPPKPSSLSARLSFVFDQIDSIEKQQQTLLSQKDQTLQRIRAWRQSKNPKIEPPQSQSHSQLGFGVRRNDNDGNANLGLEVVKEKKKEGMVVEVVHPWPEWIELMERLVGQNYFDHRRKDEDRMVKELGFDASEAVGWEDDNVGIDFKDFKAVHTACVNFGKDRFDIMRSLSRQDIQILVGFGCPSADKKVVFSSKLLRKYVHLDEGDVCSSCSLRNSCERAYLVTNKEDEARTIDVMRVLLTFGFEPLNELVVNKDILKQKSIKTVVRKLLHEVVKLSSVPIDPNLPPPVIKKPPPKVKQPPPPPRKRVGRDDVEMKKGDWLCPKCDFLNFAKNTVCLQCDAKRPKRQLLPGEWECPECNFLNYRRNMACFHCECKRPPDAIMEDRMQERQHGPRTRLEKIANRQEVSNAWNFDFDDNESDGADVAAFEHADSPRMAENYPLDSQVQGGNFRGPEGDFNRSSSVPRVHEKEYSDGDTHRARMGFDDFDDEEDDIDSYEIDTHHNNSAQRAASTEFSEVEGYSGSEDFEGIDNRMAARHRSSSPSYSKPSKPMRRKAAFSGSDNDGLDLDSDEDLSVHPNWKSSHVADSRQRSRGRGQAGPSKGKGLSFGSDEELGLYSDVDDDLGSELDDDNVRSSRNRLRGNKVEPDRRRNNSQGRDNFTRDSKFRSNGSRGNKRGSRRNSFNDDFDEPSQGFRGNKRGSRMSSFNDDFDEPSKGSRGNKIGSQRTPRDGWRKNDRGGDMQNFKGRRRGDSFGKQQHERHRYRTHLCLPSLLHLPAEA